MCWSISTPSVPQVETTGRELLPATEAKEPDSPVYGGLGDDSSYKRKGKQALKIDVSKQADEYNPVNM